LAEEHEISGLIAKTEFEGLGCRPKQINQAAKIGWIIHRAIFGLTLLAEAFT
jgi:uncharacterized protein YbcI